MYKAEDLRIAPRLLFRRLVARQTPYLLLLFMNVDYGAKSCCASIMANWRSASLICPQATFPRSRVAPKGEGWPQQLRPQSSAHGGTIRCRCGGERTRPEIGNRFLRATRPDLGQPHGDGSSRRRATLVWFGSGAAAFQSSPLAQEAVQLQAVTSIALG